MLFIEHMKNYLTELERETLKSQHRRERDRLFDSLRGKAKNDIRI